MPLEDRRALEQRVRDLEAEVARLRQGGRGRSVRRRATWTILGLPAWDVALGPAPEAGEVRGHARGFVAVGDVATGVLALGGIARGVLALGGVSVGLVTWGGLSLGLLLGMGGAAVGGAAFGGGALGGVAVGGGAVGWYALGGGAAGAHVVSGTRQDPEAVAFFERLGLPVPPPPRRR
ncbi:MAG: hypothetical protein NDI82_02110, partial [Anaeromyxobacteraceae bacterium]|nr:hypothetical protein [Anaeromyxobacteraceae bacterium]